MGLRRCARAFVALMVLATGSTVASMPSVASAAPFTTAFDALVADLQSRRAAYVPPLTPARKAELRSIDASLARLAKPHDEVADDGASAVQVARTLRSGFPAEFDPNTATSGLAGLVAGAIQSLVADAEKSYGRIDDAIATMPDSRARTAASAKLAAARQSLGAAAAPGATPATAAQQLLRALRSLRRATAIARPFVDGFFTARVDGRLFTAASIRSVHFTAVPYLSIIAARPGARAGEQESISIFVRNPAVGAHEIGAFDFSSGNWAIYALGTPADDPWYSQITDPASSVTITEFDPDAQRVTGTFSFVAMRNGTSTKKITSGTFRLTRLDPQ